SPPAKVIFLGIEAPFNFCLLTCLQSLLRFPQRPQIDNARERYLIFLVDAPHLSFERVADALLVHAAVGRKRRKHRRVKLSRERPLDPPLARDVLNGLVPVLPNEAKTLQSRPQNSHDRL